MGAFCTNSVQRLPNFLFSCKSHAAFLVGHVLNSCQYTIILYFEVWIVQTPCTYLMYYMYVYVSVRYSLLDDAECRDPVYCIAHTMSTRSISPVGLLVYRYILQHYSQYILDQWPKSGIPGAFVAKIGYLSISVFATPPGRHVIGRRRPPPDDGHTSGG